MSEIIGKRKSEEITNSEREVKCIRTDTNQLNPKGYHASRKGEREDMQDSHVVIDDFREILSSCNEIKHSSYYAVFDGHNGVRAAKFSASHLHKNMADKFPEKDFKENLKRCLIESYKKTDDDFLTEARKVKPPMKDGTTATAALILDNVVYVSNLGDSRAILCRYKPEEKRSIALTLTVDHNPTKVDERMRIQQAGGTVKDGRVLGQLEVSRSIGDGQYKNHGVTCLPDVKCCTISPNDRYLLIACDGLWKSFSNSEVISFIDETVSNVKKKVFESSIIDLNKTQKDYQYEAICGHLTAEAVRKGSGDNVTVVLVVLNDFLAD